MTCTHTDGCTRDAMPRGRLCWHHYRLQRSGKDELRAYGRDPLEALDDAYFDLLDLSATDSDGWERARAKRRVYAARFAKAWALRMGWTPPEKT